VSGGFVELAACPEFSSVSSTGTLLAPPISTNVLGGTVNYGPPRPFFTATGPGAPIAGNAPAIGIVNYTEIKLSRHDFLSLRPIDILDDKKGERTGYATTYES
jgi:hypothetical protein